MSSLNEISYSLLNAVRGGRLSDDSLISMRQAKFWVKNTRMLLVKRDMDKNKDLDPELIQDLGCVEVELVDKAECCDIKTDCFILRTKKKIPKTISAKNYYNYIYLGTVDGNEQFQSSTYEAIKWSQYEKYTSKLPRYYPKDGRAYIINKDMLDNIRIRDIFEDPGEAQDFVTCDGEACYSDDDRFPVPGWMIPMINDIVLSKELRIAALSPNDERNDARQQFDQQPETASQKV